MSTQKLEELISRLEKVVVNFESKGTTQTAKKETKVVQEEESEAVVAYKQYHTDFVAPFLESCKKIGGDVATIGNMTELAFAELQKLIWISSVSKKPSDQDLGALAGDLIKKVQEISNFAKSKKGTEQFNHLSTIGEGIAMLVWPVAGNTPKSYIEEMGNASQFFSNKILMQYKNTGDSGKVHVDYVNQFKAIPTNLALYVKEHHTTGLAWNPKGGDAKSAKPTTSSEPKKEEPKKEEPKKKSDTPIPGKGLFAQLNSIGSGDTKLALHKVEASEKTKNRKPEEKISVVSETKPKVVKKSRITGTAIKELREGTKWYVENHEGEGKLQLEVQITSTKESVYIRHVDNAFVIIKGKFNSVVMDDCHKTTLVFENIVSSVEVVNCKSVKIQVTGAVPTMLVDKTDGIIIYLAETSLHTTIVSSKSSEMNVSVPEGEDEQKELPIPEQYVSSYDKDAKKLITKPNSHLG